MVAKLSLRIFTLASGIMTIVAIVMTPFSNQAFWGLVWWQVIAIVFILSGIGAIAQLWIENQHVISELPSLKIKPGVTNRRATLEIYNDGGNAKFTAIARLVKNHPDHMNINYTLYWETDTAIGPDGKGIILIALQETTMTIPPMFGLSIYQIVNNEVKPFWDAMWPLGITQPPADIEMEISINSDKKMRNKFQQLKFKLSQQSTTSMTFEYIGCTSRKLKRDKEGYLS
jgi:hypothetical protein